MFTSPMISRKWYQPNHWSPTPPSPMLARRWPQLNHWSWIREYHSQSDPKQYMHESPSSMFLLCFRRQFKFLRVATRFGLLAEACLALLLLPVLRGMALFRFVGVQFEASVRYHVWLGTAMIFFATFHGVSTLIVWGIKDRIQDEVIPTLSLPSNTCLQYFSNKCFNSFLLKQQMGKWQKTGRIYLAGEIALVTGLVIWITSLPPIRRKRFEIFYYTHHLYIVFLLFFLFHGGDRHFYMVFGGVFLFGLDKLLRIIQSRPQTCILSARVFPCKAIELVVAKDPGKLLNHFQLQKHHVKLIKQFSLSPIFFFYKYITGLKYAPTSIIFMKIPSISRFQWHSFSITSSSNIDDNTMSVIIKCGGWWTNSLSDIIHAELDSGSNQMKCIPIAIEGPYGPALLDFLRCVKGVVIWHCDFQFQLPQFWNS